MVCKDYLESDTLYTTIEAVKEVQDLITKMNEMQLTINEALYFSVCNKINEYLDLYKNTKVELTNDHKMKEMLKGSKDLLTLKSQLEEMVFEDMKFDNANEENGAALFEDQ